MQSLSIKINFVYAWILRALLYRPVFVSSFETTTSLLFLFSCNLLATLRAPMYKSSIGGRWNPWAYVRQPHLRRNRWVLQWKWVALLLCFILIQALAPWTNMPQYWKHLREAKLELCGWLAAYNPSLQWLRLMIHPMAQLVFPCMWTALVIGAEILKPPFKLRIWKALYGSCIIKNLTCAITA